MADEIHPEALKLYKSIAKISNADIAYKVAFGYQLPMVPTIAERQAWVGYTMRMLERGFNLDEVHRIRQACHCGRGMTKIHRRLLGSMTTAHSLEELAAALGEATGDEWYHEDGALYRRRTICTCPMVEDIERLPGRNWCRCCEGYYQALFGQTLGSEVEAELVQSLKLGDEACLVRITPKGEVRFG